MTESAILLAVLAAADTWAKAHGGRAKLAEDPQHAVELLLAGSPGGFCVAVYWQGDEAAGEEGIAGDTRVEGTVACAMWRPMGLKERGTEGPATLTLASGLRAAVFRDTDTAGMLDGPNYAGKAPLQGIDGRLLSGYVLRFKVLYAYDFQEQTQE